MTDTERSGPAVDTWHRWKYVFFGAMLVLLGVIVTIHFCAEIAAKQAEVGNLRKQVHRLSAQIEQLAEVQALPGTVLNRYRTSIGYIYASYSVGFPNQPAELQSRVSGSGFLIADGLVATNRHIAEPWLGDSDAQSLIRNGARPVLQDLVIFFPDLAAPVSLRTIALSGSSDLAILGGRGLRGRPSLPLAKQLPSIGDPVVVSGYPLGIAGMLARSPSVVNERFADLPRDIQIAKHLAELSLIRPLVSCGRVGDIVGEELVYDAPTAHGGSGGPVFNAESEVIAVNSAFLDGFSGGSMGISVESLRELLHETSSSAAGPSKRHSEMMRLGRTILKATSK